MDIKEALNETIENYSKHAELYSELHMHELLQFQLNGFLSRLPGSKILDLGCGPGRDAAYFTEEGFQVTGIDLAEGLLEEFKKNAPKAECKKMDILNLKFSENTFDGIWAMSSILHIPKKEIPKAFTNFYQALKPSGILYIATKQGTTEGLVTSKKLNCPLYISYFQQKELEEFLKDANFKIIESTVSESGDNHWIEIMAKKEVSKNIS